jgi:hypothetical protein
MNEQLNQVKRMQMNKFARYPSGLTWSAAMLLAVAVAGCGGGGGQDPILGSGGPTGAIVSVPMVTATAPRAKTPAVTGVATNSQVTATFSKDMTAASINSTSFTLACPVGTPVTGTVTYGAASRVASFAPSVGLPTSTICTATITTAAKDSTGVALANAFVWTFKTAGTADTTRPTVTSIVPAASAVGVPTNTSISVAFSEAMDPATLTGASVTLTGPGAAAIAGSVSYAIAGKAAIFTPSSVLAANTLFSATVTTAAKDLAGNALAANKTWTFTTGATADTTAPTVSSTNPLDAATGVCTGKTVNVTFSEAMNPQTINTSSFTLATSAGVSVTGLVSYDAQTNIASFNPSASLTGTPSTSYTVTIKGGASGVKDLAGNVLAADKVTTFTTNASTCKTAPDLGAAGPFGGFGGNATLTNDGLATVINGDIGVNAASTKITGLRDSGGNVYTVTPDNDGMVNGLVYTLTAPPGSVAGAAVTQARSDALTAFNTISPGNLPGGIDVSSLAQCPSCGGAAGGPDELAGRTLPPGVYLSTAGTYDIGGLARPAANLTLDAQGDADAVWIFQTSAGTGTLNVGLTGPATPAVPIQVLLVNGAKAANVFWYVPGGASIGTGSTMIGTMLSDAAITISTTGGSPPTAVTTTLNGRALAITAGVSMTNTVINVPAP